MFRSHLKETALGRLAELVKSPATLPGAASHPSSKRRADFNKDCIMVRQQERNKLFKCPKCGETNKLQPIGLHSDRVKVRCGSCENMWASASKFAFALFKQKVEMRIAKEQS